MPPKRLSRMQQHRKRLFQIWLQHRNRPFRTQLQLRKILFQMLRQHYQKFRCRILAQLHRAEPPIIHRDIKPGNIILTEDGTVKLLDMNAARQLSEGKEADTRLLGTAGYAAPEQYGFAQSDARTDIYAAGVLMNVLRTGCLPQEKLAGGSLRRIVRKCTHIDPNRRYASAGELLAALGAEPAESERGSANTNTVFFADDSSDTGSHPFRSKLRSLRR